MSEILCARPDATLKITVSEIPETKTKNETDWVGLAQVSPSY